MSASKVIWPALSDGFELLTQGIFPASQPAPRVPRHHSCFWSRPKLKVPCKVKAWGSRGVTEGTMTRKQETCSAKWTAHSNEEFQETYHAKKRKRLQVQRALVQLQRHVRASTTLQLCRTHYL